MLVRNFSFHDTNVTIEAKFSATMQPRIVGREEEGAQLPLRITLVDNWVYCQFIVYIFLLVADLVDHLFYCY